jgi:ketosteroid isomerase-like protein
MSEQNVEAFLRNSDAWNRGDLEAWLATVHPEADWHPSASLVEGGAYRGHDGFRKFWADIDAAFEELVTSFDEVRDLGDVVLALGRLRGRSKQGVPVDLEYGVLIRYRDGLALHGRSWFSHAAALEASGLGAPRDRSPG